MASTSSAQQVGTQQGTSTTTATLSMEETVRKALLNSNCHPPDEDKEQICWPYCYQIEALKDDLEEIEEAQSRLTRDYKEKSRTHDLLSRDYKKLQEDHQMLQEMLAQRERLIEEHGLMMIQIESDQITESSESSATTTAGHDDDSGFGSSSHHHQNNNNLINHHPSPYHLHQNNKRLVDSTIKPSSRSTDNHLPLTTPTPQLSWLSGPMLISRDIILLLDSFEGHTLEEKLKCMAEEREDLLREIKRLKLDLEDERQQNQRQMGGQRNGNHAMSLSSDQQVKSGSQGEGSSDADVKKLLHEYKFKLKRSEQEVLLLQGNNSRLENQLSRVKGQLIELEKSEEDLKAEKRKILRELREVQQRVDELETENSHLQKRIHKLKDTRVSALIGQSTSNGPSTLSTFGSTVPSSLTSSRTELSMVASSSGSTGSSTPTNLNTNGRATRAYSTNDDNEY